MTEAIGLLIFLVLVIYFARIVKPFRKMSDKIIEESQRIRFEVAKIAEEVAVIRKNLQKGSGDQDTDL
jgi:hypothetical protein